MRFASLALLAATTSCGMPSDNFTVSDFVVGCSALQPKVFKKTIDTFANERQLTISQQPSTKGYIGLRMDRGRSGNDFNVDYWVTKNTELSQLPEQCGAGRLPCVRVTASTLGVLPDVEVSEGAESQRATASVLKRRLEDTCKT